MNKDNISKLFDPIFKPFCLIQIQMHYDHLHWKLASFTEPEPRKSDYDHLISSRNKINWICMLFVCNCLSPTKRA